jgi:hypothetical protein
MKTKIPIVERTKAYVCGCSPAELAVSNPGWVMDAFLLLVLCIVRYRSLRPAYH